ncbi:MAG: hypothetical protein V4436_01880 [Patescibacteria group bacterium]
MKKFFVIAWRPNGQAPYFFRGDDRYEIFLPYISEEITSRGWVKDIERARVFDTFPDFGPKSLAKNIDAERLRIFPYEGEILPTQVVRPTRRPRRRAPFD